MRIFMIEGRRATPSGGISAASIQLYYDYIDLSESQWRGIKVKPLSRTVMTSSLRNRCKRNSLA